MGSRVVGAIGLSLAVLVTACTSTTGGPGGVATASSEPVLDAIANGADVRSVYSYAPNVDVSFAVGPGIKTLADLKGKTMGIQEAGGFADVMTRIILKKAGLDPTKDVKFFTTTTAGRVQALATGQTDTAVLHIDQVKTAQKQTPTISVLANMWEVLTEYQYAVYIVP